MKIYKLICLICSFICCGNAEAFEIKFGSLEQGGIVYGTAKGYTEIKIGERRFMVDDNGDFLLAFERDASKDLNMSLIKKDGTEKQQLLLLRTNKWDVQKISGISQKKVTPSANDLAAIKDERRQVQEAVSMVTKIPYWKNGFMQPLNGRVSGKFGGQRIMNGHKMNPHNGMDIAAPVGTPVAAAGDGEVVLAANDLFYTGNVVIVNHGYGLQTIYAHLNEISVKNGQKLKKGDLIGKVGKTGRVSGPHLHWGATLNGIRFNPITLLQLNNSEKNNISSL
ncbi:MAG: M23 family metallopeptidase [Alphaproteobacteria bacterium]|nr:M23 family metallopeptidase [Alphaproteobacteria bacterium]